MIVPSPSPAAAVPELLRPGVQTLDQLNSLAALQVASASTTAAPVSRLKLVPNVRRYIGSNVRMHPYYYVQYVPLGVKQDLVGLIFFFS